MRIPHNEHPQSLRQKMGPSCPRVPRLSKRDCAKTRALAQTRIMLHRHIHANFALVRRMRGIWRVLALANCRRNDCVSADHLPPTSLAKTTNLALPCSPDSSGYARSFLRRGSEQSGAIFANHNAHVGCHLVAEVRRVLCPEQPVRHGTMAIHLRRPPDVGHRRGMGNKSKSLTMTFVGDLPTHTCALSKANPRRRRTPASAQPARWWPRTSRRRPHRQEREEGGRGSQRRRRNSTRKAEESKRDNGEVEKQVNGTLDSGPLEI